MRKFSETSFVKELFAALSLLISLSGSAKRTYTIPKDDFVKQFSDSLDHEIIETPWHTTHFRWTKRIYCYKENGLKVWLIVNESTILILNQNNGKKKKLLLTTTMYKNGIIEATAVNSLGAGPTKTYDFSEVSSIAVQGTRGERERTYFDVDNRKNLLKLKRDSLEKSYASDSQYVIYLVVKKFSNKDTLAISENASYNLKFKDNNEVRYGIVQKVTLDSIYISNRYSEQAAKADKTEYKIYGYPIADISELNLLHSGGLYYRTKKAGEWDVVVVRDKRRKYESSWFSLDWETGEIDLVRWWLTNDGFRLVYEKGGRVYWWGA